MDCPACRTPLVVLEYRGIAIDYCPGCEGSWYDAGELELILGRDESVDVGAFAARRKGKRRCPHCSRRMGVGPLAGTGVEVDLCTDHGLWLDRGELEAIVRAGGFTASGHTLAKFCKDLFGGAAPPGKPVPPEEKETP